MPANNIWPTYTFQVNLPTLHQTAGDWVQPNRTTTDGNETVTEESNLPKTRSTWIPGRIPGGFGNLAQVMPELWSNGASVSPQHGQTFTVSGLAAVYLKRTYCPGTPEDVLIFLGQS